MLRLKEYKYTGLLLFLLAFFILLYCFYQPEQSRSSSISSIRSIDQWNHLVSHKGADKFLHLNSPEDDAHLREVWDVLQFLATLSGEERRIYSQNQEDGITEALLNKMGGPLWKYFVEFGVSNGVECNTRFLREMHHWQGLWMDYDYFDHSKHWHKEAVYHHNVVQLFQKYQVPQEFDLLSVDTDLKDYWILRAILEAHYRPRIIIVEINSFLGPVHSLTVPKNASLQFWDFTQYFGFSVTAAWKLARQFNYSLVYCESHGVNCFMVRDGPRGLGDDHQWRISDYLTPLTLWKPPYKLTHKLDTEHRPFIFV